MSNKAEIIIKLDAKGQREVQSALGGVRKETDGLDGSVSRLDKSMVGLGIGVGAVAFGVLKLGKLTLDTTAMFQKLNAMLKTATGSSEGAAEAMDLIRSIASDTPFQITQLTSAYIKLKNLGLNPTKEALMDYGNIAAGMGKELDQMIEAAADASVMEFERLKEFGIKASKQGDQVTFTFRGVKTTVKAEAAEINTYLQDLGRVQFAGAMTEQMDTLDGAASNLSDSWDQLLNSIGNKGPAEVATRSMRDLTIILSDLNGLINPDKQKQIRDLEMTLGEAINQMDQARKHADWTWNPWGDPEEWQNRVDEITIQLNKMKGLDPFARDVSALKRAAGANDVAAHQTASAGYTPPDQGNLDIYSAEGKATPDDTWLMRSKGLDADAIERAKTAKLEISQWFRDQEMIEADQLYESELLRFEQKQDAIYREIEMEQQAADERVRIEAQAQDAMQGLRTAAMANAINVLQLLAGENKAFALAAIGVQTFLALQSAYKATAAAATLAFASQLIPGDPTSMGRALAASKAAWVMGGINMALIGAGGAIQASQALDGSQPAGYGGGTPNSPTVTAPAASTAESPAATQEVHIHFPPGATVVGMSPEEWSRRFITEFRQATEDGA